MDILGLTETCFNHMTEPFVFQISAPLPPEYCLIVLPLTTSLWEWRLCWVSGINKHKVMSRSAQVYSSFESVCIEISGYSFTWNLLCSYCPLGITSSIFVNVLDLLEKVATIHTDFYIFDDFNLHLDTQSTAISTFKGIFAKLDLKSTFLLHIYT